MDGDTDLNLDRWIPIDPFGRYLTDEVDILALEVGRHRCSGETRLLRDGRQNLTPLSSPVDPVK